MQLAKEEMMEENWVDFKTVKAAVDMERLLSRYRIDWLHKSGNELRGRCPIHRGEGQNTFHVSLSKNAFQCFSCKARGNVLDFVAAMEKCSLREAALKLKEWFSVDVSATAKAKPAASRDRGAEQTPAANKPLGFQLKGVDCEHAYLKNRGITPETAREFGVGFFGGKGSMHGRVVIPIHNERGELLAYAGRSIDGSEPKYKLPAGFHKSLELYNLHRVGESDGVILVEGFFDAMKVAQSGFPVLALMGSSLSSRQEELVVQRFKRVVLMFDGDEAGRKATEECLGRLGGQVWVRTVALPDNNQPDHLDTEDIQRLVPPLVK
jgi:DNA primase